MTRGIIVYLIAANLAAFALMGADKRWAQRCRWRIPERTLFLSALVGGSLGAILGMYFFHHKTKHLHFVVGLPLILLAQLILGVWISNGG